MMEGNSTSMVELLYLSSRTAEIGGRAEVSRVASASMVASCKYGCKLQARG
jgi:hypothetical protein